MDRTHINRHNAQHSTGPKTEGGKSKSSLNALRHGLTSQIIVLPHEDLQAFRQLLKSFLNEYHPNGPTESHLVQTLAETAWRLHRASAHEINLLTLGVRTPDQLTEAPAEVQEAMAIAASLESRARALNNLSLHAQRLNRQFEKTLMLLKQLQAERRQTEQEQLEQAADLVQMHQSKGEPYDPAVDGFVFTKPEIDCFLRRRDREKRAVQARLHHANAAA